MSKLPKWVTEKRSGERKLFHSTSHSLECSISDDVSSVICPSPQTRQMDITGHSTNGGSQMQGIDWVNSFFGVSEPKSRVPEAHEGTSPNNLMSDTFGKFINNMQTNVEQASKDFIETVDNVHSTFLSIASEIAVPNTDNESYHSLSTEILDKLAGQDVTNDVLSTSSTPVLLDGPTVAKSASKDNWATKLQRSGTFPSQMWTTIRKKQKNHRHADRECFPGLEPRGFSFCPGGLLLGYHLGVCKVLKDFGYLTEAVPMAGSSAGGLASVVLGLNIPAELGMRALYRVGDKCIIGGAKNKLKDYLVDEIGEFFEADTYEKLNNRESAVTVAYRRVWPLPFKSRFPNKFHSNDDLLKCLIASCNIPFYTTDSLSVSCRGEHCVDGYFSVAPSDFGCPPTGAQRDVRVVCFPLDNLQMVVKDNDCISPSLIQHDHDLSDADVRRFYSYIEDNPTPTRIKCEKTFLNYRLTAKSGESASLLDNMSLDESSVPESPSASTNWGTLTYGIFHMAGLVGNLSGPLNTEQEGLSSHGTCDTWMNEAKLAMMLPAIPFTIAELLIIALDHTSDNTMQMCFESGRADAFRWLIREERRDRRGPFITDELELLRDHVYIGLEEFANKKTDPLARKDSMYEDETAIHHEHEAQQGSAVERNITSEWDLYDAR